MHTYLTDSHNKLWKPVWSWHRKSGKLFLNYAMGDLQDKMDHGEIPETPDVQFQLKHTLRGNILTVTVDADQIDPITVSAKIG